MNWLIRFGFIGDLRDCIGKTIDQVEVVQMEYGCTYSQGQLIRFTDGSRCFVTGGPGNNCMPSPDLNSMKKSLIIQPEEIGQIETVHVPLTKEILTWQSPLVVHCS